LVLVAGKDTRADFADRIRSEISGLKIFADQIGSKKKRAAKNVIGSEKGSDRTSSFFSAQIFQLGAHP
jgi:hypothetical protein